MKAYDTPQKNVNSAPRSNYSGVLGAIYIDSGIEFRSRIFNSVSRKVRWSANCLSSARDSFLLFAEDTTLGGGATKSRF